ncbi:hypothetical protein D9758_011242 [Tetrapyrgos nigripes]|uniref:TEA domain-containing protein n=1 Tax=Tetrapyrgos nigripes TaxID=182062 RepID=A0A8H5D6K2_9AGAR|nr:hypothetical protein D9758_011242 [Tetrapyrgos nigripes]
MSTVDDLSYTPSTEEKSTDAAQIIATGRRTWKTLKGKREAVWPPHLEAALIEALEKYKPDDSRSSKTPGRFSMRNRFISDYIFETTGKRRTPKQVGSRLQQLRNTCKSERILQLISRRNMGGGDSTTMSNDANNSSNSPPPDKAQARQANKASAGLWLFGNLGRKVGSTASTAQQEIYASGSGSDSVEGDKHMKGDDPNPDLENGARTQRENPPVVPCNTRIHSGSVPSDIYWHSYPHRYRPPSSNKLYLQIFLRKPP